MNIGSLKPGDFSGLVRLEVLSLAYNQLTSLPVGVFDGLVELLVLSLSNNAFSKEERTRISAELPDVDFGILFYSW